MISGKFQIRNRLGLHARAAAKLVNIASSFDCAVWVGKDGQRVDGKSIMGVLLLCGVPGTWLTVETAGADEGEALDAIGALIDGRFGEDGW